MEQIGILILLPLGIGMFALGLIYYLSELTITAVEYSLNHLKYSIPFWILVAWGLGMLGLYIFMQNVSLLS